MARKERGQPPAAEVPAATQPAAGAVVAGMAKPATIDPEKYAVPYVALVQTPEGDGIRLKVKQTLATMKMVKIPAGSIEMPTVDGDGKLDPARRQTVSIKSIWMATTEVPWEFYDIWFLRQDLTQEERTKIELNEYFLHEKASFSRPSMPFNDVTLGLGRDGYAAMLSHTRTAEFYCKWLSSMTRQKWRLPTEAEWEYACRAGGGPIQLDKKQLDKVAWFYDNSMHEDGNRLPHPIAQKEPNAFGLYDMLGNLSEWVVGIDGRLVLKGGSFDTRAKDMHERSRWPYDPAWQTCDCQDPKSKWWLSDGPHAGFRVVREE